MNATMQIFFNFRKGKSTMLELMDDEFKKQQFKDFFLANRLQNIVISLVLDCHFLRT